MIFKETKLKGAYVVEVKKNEDDRGFFGRFWCQKEMEEMGLDGTIRQSNTSFSKKKGTMRGLHYQIEPYKESKFVRCIKGKVFDVMIDLRPDSPTFMEWVGTELSADEDMMVYVPGNFAHAVLSMEDDSQILYLVSEFYTPGSERGIRFDDPAFNIKWPVDVDVVTEKDLSHPPFDKETFNK